MRLLLDSNATYEYRLTSIFGRSTLMIGLGKGNMSVKDEYSYNFITRASETGD